MPDAIAGRYLEATGSEKPGIIGAAVMAFLLAGVVLYRDQPGAP
jgi:hypothetical protein